RCRSGADDVSFVTTFVGGGMIASMNNRRTNGSMKLKADDMPRMESGKAAYANPQAVTVNLMSYGNGTTATPPHQGQVVTISPLYPEPTPTYDVLIRKCERTRSLLAIVPSTSHHHHQRRSPTAFSSRNLI
ncbi:hypothetical protein GCK32_010480, partial [Trichostrongylus colubriformis]